MAAQVASNSLEEEALKRRERLKALRKKSGLTTEEVSNLMLILNKSNFVYMY